MKTLRRCGCSDGCDERCQPNGKTHAAGCDHSRADALQKCKCQSGPGKSVAPRLKTFCFLKFIDRFLLHDLSPCLFSYVMGAGLNKANSLCRPQWSAHVCLRPLATSRIMWKISSPTCSIVASPVAMRPALISIRSDHLSASALREDTLITGAMASP